MAENREEEREKDREAVSLRLPEDGPEVGATLQTNKLVLKSCYNQICTQHTHTNTHIKTLKLAKQTEASADISSRVYYALRAAER